MNFEKWLQYGYKNKWCGPSVCKIHEGLPTTIFENEELFKGNDPCIHIIRLYDDEDMKQAVEANHSASRWLADNRGFEQ